MDNSDAPTTADPLNALLEGLSHGGSHQEIREARLARTLIEHAVATISDNLIQADVIIARLFPAGVPTTEAFYDGLADVEYRLGHNDGVHRLNGLIWARAVSRLPMESGVALLNSMAKENSRSFFVALYALPTFLGRSRLTAAFLAGWIVAIRIRLGNDGAAAGFWNGLHSLAVASPQTTLELTEILVSNSVDENRIAIAGNLLGHLRATAPDLVGLPALMERLRDHSHVDRRLVYHRSWITTGLQRALTEKEFSDLLHRMSLGSKEEVDEAFYVLRVLLPLPSTPDESFLLGLRWLHDNTTSSASDIWKHFLILLAKNLYERWNAVARPAGIPSLSNLILTIFPIRDDHAATWNELEELLVFLANRDDGMFRSLLFDLARKDSQALSKRFKSRDAFHGITAAITAQHGTGTVFEALLSDEGSLRHFGFSLFEALGIAEFPSGDLEAASDNRIALLIFSFQLEPFYDEVVPRFLLALEPRIKTGSADLQTLFVDELIFQSKNLPGACLEQLKRRAADSALVQHAVEESEKYFDALRPSFNCEINSMGVPGLERAARVKGARRSREMSAQMKKTSILTHLCSTSYTLYGGPKWQTFMGGKLGEVSEMQQISHSVELPRMPGIDPDGMAIRRQNAAHAIRNLLLEENG